MENHSTAKEMKSYSRCDIYIFEYLHVYFLSYRSESYMTFIGHAKNSSQLLYLSNSPVCVVSKCYNHDLDCEKKQAYNASFFIHSFTHTCIGLSILSTNIKAPALHCIPEESLQYLYGIRWELTTLLLQAFPLMVSFDRGRGGALDP